MRSCITSDHHHHHHCHWKWLSLMAGRVLSHVLHHTGSGCLDRVAELPGQTSLIYVLYLFSARRTIKAWNKSSWNCLHPARDSDHRPLSCEPTTYYQRLYILVYSCILIIYVACTTIYFTRALAEKCGKNLICNSWGWKKSEKMSIYFPKKAIIVT